jgi:hypothetical protein
MAAGWVSRSRSADDGVQHDVITGLGGFVVGVRAPTRVSQFVDDSVPDPVEFRPG